MLKIKTRIEVRNDCACPCAECGAIKKKVCVDAYMIGDIVVGGSVYDSNPHCLICEYMTRVPRLLGKYDKAGFIGTN